jgi:hypothetical protein
MCDVQSPLLGHGFSRVPLCAHLRAASCMLAVCWTAGGLVGVGRPCYDHFTYTVGRLSQWQKFPVTVECGKKFLSKCKRTQTSHPMQESYTYRIQTKRFKK